MVARLFFALGAAFLVLAVPSSAQYWRQQNGYTYQQVYPPQQNYPNYQRPQVYPQKQGYQQQQTGNQWSIPGVSVSNADWVCKNPKTGDMMIIASEDVPVQPGTNGQQQPNYPRPPVTNQPTYPQTQPPNVQPTYPPMNPNYPTQNPAWPGNQPTQQPPQPQQPNQGTPPNSNGEGLIDIRFGESK